jgi:Fic family protein
MKYIHELPGWPELSWQREALAQKLAAVRHEQGRLIGSMEGLGFQIRQDADLQTVTADVLKSSEIEGEQLDAAQVRSSVARRLGLEVGHLPDRDRNVEGIVEMMLDATRGYERPLTVERLFDWHAALFPTARSGMRRIRVGAWRDDNSGPMQVVSGPIGRQKIHYEAPAALRIPDEMRLFLEWFNGPQERDWVVDAALAHLRLVTIHPFEDGNGRIARAIADMALARSERSPQRFYSMSTQIQRERESYYEILENTQKGTLNVTYWMEWFLVCLGRAIEGAQGALETVLFKARFWESLSNATLNERHRTVLSRLLDGFEGKLTTSKWAKLTKSSQDTAARDIARLVEQKILVRNPAGGRSTSYSLKVQSDTRPGRLQAG